jgi:hypothetical protein
MGRFWVTRVFGLSICGPSGISKLGIVRDPSSFEDREFSAEASRTSGSDTVELTDVDNEAPSDIVGFDLRTGARNGLLAVPFDGFPMVTVFAAVFDAGPGRRAIVLDPGLRTTAPPVLDG